MKASVTCRCICIRFGPVDIIMAPAARGLMRLFKHRKRQRSDDDAPVKPAAATAAAEVVPEKPDPAELLERSRKGFHLTSTESTDLSETAEILGPATCRGSEYEEIMDLLQEAVEERKGRAMYVCGCPGTGKTMTVKRVIHDLQSARPSQRGAADDAIPADLRVVFVNCMYLRTPKELLLKLHQELLGRSSEALRASPATSSVDALHSLWKPLAAFLSEQPQSSGRGRRSPAIRKDVYTVIVLDEIDGLLRSTSNDKAAKLALEKLCTLPFDPSAKFTLIGIANAMDLLATTLKRMARGPHADDSPLQVAFGTYTKDQLVQILRHRLREAHSATTEKHSPERRHSTVRPKKKKCADDDDDSASLLDVAQTGVDSAALEFVARKIAASTGDARRALDACRSAVDKALSRGSERVGVADVLDVFKNTGHSRSAATQTIQNLPVQQQLLLCALVRLVRTKSSPTMSSSRGSGGNSVNMVTWRKEYVRLCDLQHLDPVSPSEFGDMCDMLSESRLVSIVSGDSGRNSPTTAGGKSSPSNMLASTSMYSQFTPTSKKRRSKGTIAAIRAVPSAATPQRVVVLNSAPDDVSYALEHIRLFQRLLSVQTAQKSDGVKTPQRDAIHGEKGRDDDDDGRCDSDVDDEYKDDGDVLEMAWN